MSGRRFEPMLASPWPAPFSDPEWVFEIKWDGVRVLLNWTGSSLMLQSRSGLDVTATYPEMSSFFRPGACVLDGEIVAFDDTGRPSFSNLQKRLGISGGMRATEAARLAPVSYVVFDLLFDGEDVTHCPIEERLGRLRAMDLPAPAVTSDVIEEHGEALYVVVAERGLEGIVAKRHGSSYRPGVRSPDWRKIPCVRVVRAVVGGFTAGERSRAGTFGSLALGLWEGTRLRWIGSVGTGFDDAALLAIRAALGEMTTPESPFLPDSELPVGTTWVVPHLVARVEFKEWTEAGRLRAPSFKGFIAEEPEQVTWESEGPGE